jgi:[protein-PII] uridylyltransferase
LHLDADSVSLLAFLVTHAGVMSHLAERRDFSEESVLVDFVRRVGTAHRLRLLFLLEQADGGAPPRRSGLLLPESLRDLYLRSRALLCPEAPGRQPATHCAVAEGRIREHLKMMPAHYVRNVTPESAQRHLELIDQIESEELVTRWDNEGPDYSGLTICTRDFSGLFARLAGTLTAAGLDILTADLNSRADGIVLDVFRVRRCRSADAVPEPMHAAIDSSLKESIRPEADLDQALRRWKSRQSRYLGKRRSEEIRPSVRFDSRTSATSTVVEVRAEDRPGLAYLIARTLADLQVDIHFARITTERHYALDIFYVKGSDGAKLSSSEAVTVGRGLLSALDRTDQ